TMKPAKLSPDLQAIIKRTPLASRAEADKLLRGDLELGAEQYARQAVFDGGASWKVYFAIEAEIGRPFEESVHRLPEASCESLARWAFSEGRDDVGVIAVDRLLEAEEAPAGIRELADPYVQATMNAWGKDAGAEALARFEAKLPRAARPEARTAGVKGSTFRLVPSGDRSRHSFGGYDLSMPDCAACGDKLRQWFSLDVEAEPSLQSMLPGWALFPLLGCGSCRVWMFRSDYVLDTDTTKVDIVKIHAEPGDLRAAAQARIKSSPLPRANAMLVFANAPTSSPEPVVGGEPHGPSNTRAVECWVCNRAMSFIGAMASPRAFAPAIQMTGYQDHFACGRCRTLSVMPPTP
ncbi:MAG: hypothetical protein HOV80_30330, partial [Polyangiaceae bacterium]|nr:hypothetical protein [Polyangiaceae bacterium]